MNPDLIAFDSEGDELMAQMDLSVVYLPTISPSTAQAPLLPTPSTFADFPYPQPYPQQLTLMKAIYSAVENAQCGLFESPTGTGKSASLLTAVLRWLLDRNAMMCSRLSHFQTELNQLDSNNQSDSMAKTGEMDWIASFEKTRVQKRSLEPEIESLTRMHTGLERITELKQSNPNKQMMQMLDPVTKKLDEQFRILYDTKTLKEMNEENDSECNSPVDEEFLPELVGSDASGLDEPSKDTNEETSVGYSDTKLQKIIYCSRTHSQLNQVLHELSKCGNLSGQITAIQLSSRQALCTNRAVYELTHPELINETCLDFAQSNQKSGRCPMRTSAAVHRLSDNLLSGLAPARIVSALRENRLNLLTGDDSIKCKRQNKDRTTQESVHQLAVRIGCPYYATRHSLPLAQLVFVPYATLLQSRARAASGLDLKDAVIVVDEAHNLLEAVTSCQSVYLRVSELRSVILVLRLYQSRYRPRLSSTMALRLRQLLHMTQGLLRVLSQCTDAVRVVTTASLISETGSDNVSLHPLVDCLHQRHFVTKLAGFARWAAAGARKQTTDNGDDVRENELPTGMQGLLAGMKRKVDGAVVNAGQPVLSAKNGDSFRSSDQGPSFESSDLDGAGSSLFKFQAFLEALSTGAEDARVVLTPRASKRSDNQSASKETGEASLHYTVLNPGHYLQDIVRQARCVLLAGGTLQPFDELATQVFPHATDDNLQTFVCDHVIDPRKQLAVYPIVESIGGQPLEFTFQQRSKLDVMNACGEVVLQVAQNVPAGVVVFLPSYDYQEVLCTHWESTGLWKKMNQYKRVFREPRQSTALESVMQAYCASIKRGDMGALLICVIGGKLSEGINFTDDLARGVLIIGMPYPNPQCPLLRQKMNYLDSQYGKSGSSLGSIGPGRRHYEALCMRAINQAIGRAVRHAKDYAVVFLIDRRFARPNVQQQLPSWVLTSLQSTVGDGRRFISVSNAMDNSTRFFSTLRSGKQSSN